MIEIDGKIYRNLEEQVRKNKEDIESIDTNVTSNTNAITGINNRLDNLDLTYATDEDIQNLQSQINTKANQSDLNSTNLRVSTLESTVTQLSPQVAKSLKTPMSAPSSTELVAIDTSNGQAMISIGTGLVIENDTLKSTGGVQIIDNLTSTSTSAALSANQGRVLSNTISTVTSSVDSNTEQIEFLQADMADKTNVTINNVHQDYVNFSSDPQTQINLKASISQLTATNTNVEINTQNITTLNNTKANKDLSNIELPIGYIYISTSATSPASIFGGTWEQVAQGRTLFGAGTLNGNTYTAGQTVNAGLPDLQGMFTAKTYEDAEIPSGVFERTWTDRKVTPSGQNKDTNNKIEFKASKYNSIYGNSTTVQPNAYVVYIWEKIS